MSLHHYRSIEDFENNVQLRPVHPMARSADDTAPSANDTRETRKPAQPARKHEDVRFAQSAAFAHPILQEHSGMLTSALLFRLVLFFFGCV
jgi:hypothetical protein